MGREWKPGDVALVQVSSAHGPEVAVSSDSQWFVAGPRLGSQHGWYHDRVTVVRPLVVIDPEDREAVGRLVEVLVHFEGPGPATFADRIQLALREFADPTPPTPEPTDATARVTDRRDNIWRLLADGEWVCTSGPDIGEYLTWDRLAAERGPLEVEFS